MSNEMEVFSKKNIEKKSAQRLSKRKSGADI